MRRHSKATSSGPNDRKRDGHGASMPAGRLRLAILAATVAAFLLVPAAQAMAAGTLKVNVVGTGSGEVKSEFGFADKGSPPIECSYASPGPATGVCENEMSVNGLGQERVEILSVAGPGSDVGSVTLQKGKEKNAEEFGPGYGCNERSGQEEIEEVFGGWACEIEGEGGSPSAEVTVCFVLEGEGEAGCPTEPTGPTNRRTLTITKSAGGTGGMGSVKSKPAGINCGTACNEAVASMYKATPVTLTAKPSATSTFVEWTGACTGSSPTCTVPMAEDEAVTAVFGGTSKAIFNPQALSLSKGESTGYGTVKASGLVCEAACTTTTVLYQGPNVEKAKPGKTVTLTQAAAPGSVFVEWGGACTGSGSCVVTMEAAKEVTATFEALPAQTLTLTKSAGGSGGMGSVKSKPAGINCGTACSSADATLWEGAVVTLTAKPSATSTFVEWEGGDCNGSTSTTCTETLDVAEEVTAVFGGISKAIFNPQALTLSKSGSGLGTVKASGLVCEAACTTTTVLYQGPNVEKAKPGKTVALTQAAAPGSEFVEWTGACTGSGACEVTMEAAKSVGAVFDELE